MGTTAGSRAVVAACILGAALLALSACKSERVFTVGILNCNERFLPVVAGFTAGMAEQGFIEGKNLAYIDKRSISCDDAETVLGDMLKQKTDLIFIGSAPLVRMAKRMTAASRTPVVFAPVYSATALGLVDDMRRPGGNLTGIQVSGNVGKALEWHRAVLPGAKILAPYKKDDEVSGLSLGDLKQAAGKLGVTVVARGVSTPAELRAALSAVPSDIGAIWLLNSNFLVSRIDEYIAAAKKHRLPVSGTGFSSRSILISYSPDQAAVGSQASRLAAKVLRGVPPGEIPVEEAEFHLRINLRVADELGIKVPIDVLEVAEEIVH